MDGVKTGREVCEMNVFEKVKKVREVVGDVYPLLSVEELAGIVGFLSNHWHGKKRKRNIKLTQQQLLIYDLLLKNGFNPATVYKWLLLATAPGDVREQVRDGVPIVKALRQRRKTQQLLSIDEKQFIEAVIKCVEQFVSEPGEGYPGRFGQ